MNKERIEKAVEVINYAIKNQITVKEASVKCGYSDTYVKNIRAVVSEKYENGVLDDELFDLFNTAYSAYLHGGSAGWTKLFNTEVVVPNPSSRSVTPTTEEKLSYSENGNEATMEWKTGSNYPADHIKTLDELLKATKVDTSIWKVKDFTVNKWDVTAMVDKLPKTIQNFQVKARLEKDVQASKERMAGELFREMTGNYKAPVLTVLPNLLHSKENNLLEITLFDLHLGKLAHKQETGENYDTKIASKRFIKTIETLINHASGFPYSRILFPIGNDFFNGDDINGNTVHGTVLDNDSRWQQAFERGIKLLVDAINLLKQTGVPVDVLIIPGNHDYSKSYYMGAYLSAFFNEDPMVNINNDSISRKYYRFGQVLLGFTHGSEEKESALPLLMATDIDSKPMWSETKYHEYHVGHQHRKRDVKYTTLERSQMTTEDLGVTVRYLSSLTSTDAWHFSKGFVGSLKAGEAFIWGDEAGLIAHLNANLIIE